MPAPSTESLSVPTQGLPPGGLPPTGTVPEDEDTRAPLPRRALSAVLHLPSTLAGLWRAMRKRRATRGRKRGLSFGLLALLLVLVASFAWSLHVLFTSSSPGPRLGLDELTALAKQHRVVAVTLQDADNRAIGTFTATGADALRVPRLPDSSPVNDVYATGSFHVDYPSSAPLTADLYRTLTSAGAQVHVDHQTGKQQLRLVTTFLLPLMILATVFALLLAPGSRGGGGGIGEVTDFSQVRNGRVKKGASKVTFADAGGVEEAVTELVEVVDYLKNPAKYEAMGAAPPKGLLLFGPPGCGKTLLAKAVAGEAEVPFFSVAGAEFVEALVGVGAARVRDLFARVRQAAPAIIFIDELDAAGRKRGAGGSSGGSDEREQTLNQLLVEMDGFDASRGIVVIGATNRPDILDPALRRPGRFDRHITIERPDHAGRLRILQIHAADKPTSEDVDLDAIADKTPGFTGADLANVVNEAALLTIRDQRQLLMPADFDEAIRRVLEGPKRRGHLLSVADKRRAAVHEAGHMVVALACEDTQSIQRVSILGGGKAIATTELRSDDEEAVLTESQLRTRLAVRLAGAAAERAVFGEISTGVERDAEVATGIARDMVARYGMAEELAPSRLLGADSSAFLGDSTPWDDISEETKSAAEAAIRRMLREGQTAAADLLDLHRDVLDYAADLLVEAETLEGPSLTAALADLKERLTHSDGSPRAAAPRRRKAVKSGS